MYLHLGKLQLQLLVTPPETVHEDDNESSTSESDSLTDEEEEKKPSLAVCRCTSSRIDSTSHIESLVTITNFTSNIIVLSYLHY